MASWRRSRRPSAARALLLLASDALVLLVAGAALLATTWSNPRPVADAAAADRSAPVPVVRKSSAAATPVGPTSPTAGSTPAVVTTSLASTATGHAAARGVPSGTRPARVTTADDRAITPLVLAGTTVVSLFA